MSLRTISSLLVFIAVSFVLAAGLAMGQTAKKMSARELFYSLPAEEPMAKKTAILRANRTRGEMPIGTTEVQQSDTESSSEETRPGDNALTQTPPGSHSFGNTVPLGLRFGIIKTDSSGSTEVDPNTVFRSGDRIRLRVGVNTAGYLYIISRGSSGNWNPLFPSAKIENGDNRVRKGTQYEIPPDYVFTFDAQPGTEKLFVVFSRQPVSDLEELIYDLTGGQRIKTQVRTDSGKLILAQANIQNGIIDRLRSDYSRDLIIEKVDETKAPSPSAPATEKAVYVVNLSRSTNSCVVADVPLIHK